MSIGFRRLNCSESYNLMSRTFALVAIVCFFALGAAQAAETLPNGLERVEKWTPPTAPLTDDPMPLPYLTDRPDVVPIDVGRQLFVDDFLIESTDFKRTFHRPKVDPRSPVLKPETPWERDDKQQEDWAAPFSDGVWYDAKTKTFRMWYHAAEERTCLAESQDGIVWARPSLDVEPGTNIVLTSQNRASIRNSNTVWLDAEATDPARRYVLFEARYARSPYRMAVRTSADGVHWSDELAVSGSSWDRSTAFYNPFRKVWVASVRGHDSVKPTPPHRLRCYFEGRTPEEAVGWKQHCDEVAKGNLLPNDLIPWVGADRLDPRNPDSRFSNLPPQLYNLDVFPYESLLVGLFTIWQGPANEACKELNIHKRNEVFIGFTRDGFHWHRPSRERFISVGDDPQAWNAGNVQSVGGGCLVVGDELRFYFSGRTMTPRSTTSTGLATLPRDGFASMDAPIAGGQLTTRPVRFTGSRLFVNAWGGGALSVEVLDREGRVIPGFSRDHSRVFGEMARAEVRWKDEQTLASLRDQPVRFRFHLGGGSLWSFWVTDDRHGASRGYVAAGGPEFKTSRDQP